MPDRREGDSRAATPAAGTWAERPLAPQTIVRTQEAVARFYAFMFDYQAQAAAALGDARWLELTSAHARLWRPEEEDATAASSPRTITASASFRDRLPGRHAACGRVLDDADPLKPGIGRGDHRRRLGLLVLHHHKMHLPRDPRGRAPTSGPASSTPVASGSGGLAIARTYTTRADITCIAARSRYGLVQEWVPAARTRATK